MESRRPRGRERNNTGEGKGIKKRGATGNGPVGSGDALNKIRDTITDKVREEIKENSQNNRARQESQIRSENRNSRPFVIPGMGNSGNNASYGQQTYRRSGSGLKNILLLILVVIMIYFLLKSLGFFGNDTVNNATAPSNTDETVAVSDNDSNQNLDNNSGSQSGISSGITDNASPITGGSLASTSAALASAGGYSTGWTGNSNNGIFNAVISPNARDKFTDILGNNQDEWAIYIYLCGTDLESKSAMATRDLQEMLDATLSDNVKIVLLTGGCTNWQNNVMNSSVNEIYEITSAGLNRISSNAGTTTMVDPDNLEAFIKWASQNYDANRKALIFWDHGGGSVQGYGYDEKYPRQGSMTLDEINQALSNTGVKFDFIGFDACLMATAETALMCSEYADYLIASEEVEPGIGWYYTSWLNAISDNSSISTVDMAKTLIDDFTAQCERYCRGQETTLSIVDLSELSQTLPEKLSAFAQEVSAMIEDGRYKSIARARSSSHEFAASTRIDQVDLAHFASLLDTDASRALAQTIVDAVKYNRTAKSLNNAYGLSIYFPYASFKNVDQMSSTYRLIGIDDNYTSCIKKFAQMQVSGQASSGGSSDPFWSLINGDGSGLWTSDYSGSSNTWGSSTGNGYGSSLTQQAMEELIIQLLGGRFTDFESLGMRGLNSENTRFLSESPIDATAAAQFIYANILDPEDFIWKKNGTGDLAIILSQDKWDLVSGADMAMFYDDGEGFFDLGIDNIYDFDDEGNLLPVIDHSWVSIDDQPVAYYHMATYDNSDDDYSIIGKVPILLNGDPADLILVFDNENPDGYVAGFRYGYQEDVTDVQAKTCEELNEGDVIDFVCDYYAYDGTFLDSYMIGDQYVVNSQDDMVISNTDVGSDVLIAYRFTDIYGETYWTPTLR